MVDLGDRVWDNMDMDIILGLTVIVLVIGSQIGLTMLVAKFAKKKPGVMDDYGTRDRPFLITVLLILSIICPLLFIRLL